MNQQFYNLIPKQISLIYSVDRYNLLKTLKRTVFGEEKKILPHYCTL